MTETEAIDRLYLELSQFTKAKTAREIELEKLIKRSWEWVELIQANYPLSITTSGKADALAADLLAALKDRGAPLAPASPFPTHRQQALQAPQKGLRP